MRLFSGHDKISALKNPYFGKAKDFVYGSEDFVRQAALEDRFRHCQTNLTVLGFLFGKVTPVEQFGSSNTKFEAEWQEMEDTTVYDEDGLTREDNEDS